MISGDIRMEWESIKEKWNGERARGSGARRYTHLFNGARIPDNQFDVEFNLMFDYRGSCTWAVAHLEFDQNAGIDVNPRGCCGYSAEGCTTDGSETFVTTDPATDSPAFTAGDPNGCHGSGNCSNLCLRKAYFGWNVFEECNSRLDIEIGRRNLYDVFDSRVQFGSRFDGLLLRYSNCFECVGDFYVNLGVFVVDENSNHWGWAMEAGLLDIADYGVDFKYSFIDWAKNGENRCEVNDPVGMQAMVSQFYLAYNFNPEILCTRAKIYGALLWNHDAEDNASFGNNKENMAWYVGFQVGEVCKEGDWAFDINWQYVEAQAILECDLTGIGKGNVRDIPGTVSPAYGWLNYQGIRAEASYAVTDNVVLNPSWEYSEEIEDTYTDSLTNTVGSASKYSKFELQVIYAF
jgi:hypothetical protein